MPVIIGLNIGHDAGVSVIDGQKVLFAANEERFSRIKNHVGFPSLALEEALSLIGKKQVDLIAVEGKRVLQFKELGAYTPENYPRYIKASDRLGLSRFFLGTSLGVSITQSIHFATQFPRRQGIISNLRKFGLVAPINFYDHHEAHNATAVFAGSRKKGVSISMDASGEGYCSKVFYFDGQSMKHLGKYDLPSYFSIANMYKHITYNLGFKPLRHEGKITGLAAFGNSEETARIIHGNFGFNEESNLWTNKFGYGLPAAKKLSKALIGFSREDIAAGIQKVLEENIVGYLKKIVLENSDSGVEHVYLSGGLFANVKLNQRIVEQSWSMGVEVAPNMGDGGLNLGVALLANGKPVDRLRNLYLGTPLDTHDIIDLANKYNCKVRRVPNPAELVARSLSEGLVVAIARNRMEYGPRALCNRSILYSATNKDVNSWLNKRLNRTEFMPFAPVIRDIDANSQFEIDSSSDYSNMTITCLCTSSAKRDYPAIVHVDGTARPQVLEEDVNPFMYEVLTKYKAMTSKCTLVNTSFNMHEEPIVRSTEDSIKAFALGQLDVLFLEDFEIRLT
jgi:carbamoyltransferase